jgi:hypothetical protein
MLVIAVLSAGLVGLLLLNTSMERGAYQVSALREQSAALSLREQSLQMQVGALESPQLLAEKAVRLGMVQDTSPAFLSLGHGTVIGRSVPGDAGNVFDVGPGTGAGPPRLGKLRAIVAGELNGASTGVVVHEPSRQGNRG